MTIINLESGKFLTERFGKKFYLFFIILLVLCLPLRPEEVLAAGYIDYFTSGLDPTHWTSGNTNQPAYVIDASQGDVRISKPSGGEGQFQSGWIRFNHEVRGDFDISVVYREANIPHPSVCTGNQIQINLTFGAQYVANRRQYTCGEGNSYSVWADPPAGSFGTAATTDLSGVLRITRVGSTATFYYNGNQYYQADYNALPLTYLSFSLNNNGTSDAVSVIFDDFFMTADEIAGMPCTTAPSDLVSWWGGDNNPLDMVGTNHGTLMNGTTYASGKVGQAFSLDGLDDYVQIPHSDSLNFGPAQPMSINLWVKRTSTSDVSTLFAKRSDCGAQVHYILQWYGPGDWFHFGSTGGGLGNGVHTTADKLPLNSWTFVSISFDGATATMYINGAPVASHAMSFDPNTVPLMLGAEPSCGDYFGGLLDEFEIFNRALTAEEVAAIYNAGSAGKCRTCATPPSGRVSWWGGGQQCPRPGRDQ
jgi:hypothetical protein